ncbi:unnamed protein product [Urochloa humidicola]
MTLPIDLNVPPPPLFDLNEYPEENHGGEATPVHHTGEDIVQALRNLDLNLAPQQDTDEDRPIDGARSTTGNATAYACRKELTNEERKQLYEALVCRCTSTNGRLAQEIVEEIASSFSISTRTVRRIWQCARQCFQKGADIDVSNKRSQCGRKRVQVDLSMLHGIPFSKRTTLDDLARHLKVSKSTLSRFKRKGLIRRHSNSIKPHLTEQNMRERLRWCISMLDPRSIHIDPIFRDFFNIVFIDEKCFYLMRRTGNYYLLPDEEEPYRTCKNKNFIKKVMILFALARPRMDKEGKFTFDGKIGCFPLVTYEPARRTSKNRVAGTLEMKPITSITKDGMRAFIIEKVIPAIRAKWPTEYAREPIYIQQDNARPHIEPSDPLFRQAAQQDGFNIQLIFQPPNSPDLNILDLGFFASIQSIQFKNAARTIGDIVNVVQQEFDKYSPVTSNRIFVTLQAVMIEVMKARGGNNYKTPHINKPSLEKEGKLPLQMKCDLNLVQEVCMQIEE